ncbi:MAG: hypothetical protein U1C33_05745 [Candidatus Cloacimonadaceae bacterium]|nr:hypothetical protein [Candidatus Cloacimonadaceae bacterium]
MKTKLTTQFKGSVSQIVKISDADGGGMLGFTIAYSEIYFENVVMRFQPVNIESIMTEINHKRKELIVRMDKEGQDDYTR